MALLFQDISSNNKTKKLSYLHSAGYIYIRVNGKYRPAHRVVYERFMNRPLSKNEIVHHRNSNRTDNRMENLELISRSRHTKLHWLQKLAQYHSRQLGLFELNHTQESLF